MRSSLPETAHGPRSPRLSPQRRAFAFIAEAQMPRTATGKIQHRLLREQVMASQAMERA